MSPAELMGTQFTSDEDTTLEDHAGGRNSVELYNELDLTMQESRERNRSYNNKGEKDRKIHYEHI